MIGFTKVKSASASASASAFALAFAFALVLIVTASVEAQPSQADRTATSIDSTAGIVDELPKVQPFVKCELGFMVPYRQAIPGSEVVIEMVPIRGGTFLMGSPDSEVDRSANEGPQVKIRVEPFWMGKYEITWAQYQQFMSHYNLFKKLQSNSIRVVTEENRIDAVTIPTPLYDPSFTFALGEEKQQPAVTMSQYAAKQFTKWISGLSGHFYRLPAESEWEYACRSGTTTAYYFGDEVSQLGEFAVFFDNSDDLTSQVGRKRPNRWGLYDMLGNVREIVLDQMRDGHYQQLKAIEESTQQPLSVEQSICWPDSMFQRITRGGSWEDDADQLRCATRTATDDWRNDDPNLPKSPWWFTDEEGLAVGFRIIRPLHEPKADRREKYWGADVPRLKRAIDNRIMEGRGVYGLVDPKLTDDMKQIE